MNGTKKHIFGVTAFLTALVAAALFIGCDQILQEHFMGRPLTEDKVPPVPLYYTVLFDKNGGDTDANPLSKTAIPPASTIDGLPTAPEWAGRDFKGWWTENGSPDGNTEDNWGTEFNVKKPLSANITLYARWDPPPPYFTVTFDKNGGDTDADPQSAYAAPGSTVPLPLTPPTRSGYTFYGWYTSPDNGATLDALWTADTAVTDNTTVYAKWDIGRPINYVRPAKSTSDATPYGKGDGTSWNDAYVDLQLAVNLAKKEADAGSTGTMVWVAGGTYYPWRTADSAALATGAAGDPAPPKVPPVNRDNAFVFLPDVDVYGGFNGTEPGAAAVPPVDAAAGIRSNATVLSGDLNANGSIDTGDAYHVVVVADVTGGSYDGFTIQGGNAVGAGMKPLVVRGKNIQRDYGGGLYLSDSMPTLNNVTIQSNAAETLGGGIYLDNSTPGMLTLSNVKVLGNRAVTNGKSGGGICANGTDGSFTFINVLIAGNAAPHAPSMYVQGIPTKLINVTIAGNTGFCSAIHADMIAGTGAGEVMVWNSILVGNADGGGGTTGNIANSIFGTGDPGFVSLVAPPDEMSPTTLGDYHLTPAALAAIDTGDNNVPNDLNVTTDLDLKARIAGAAVDMGCYEYQ